MGVGAASLWGSDSAAATAAGSGSCAATRVAVTTAAPAASTTARPTASIQRARRRGVGAGSAAGSWIHQSQYGGAAGQSSSGPLQATPGVQPSGGSGHPGGGLKRQLGPGWGGMCMPVHRRFTAERYKLPLRARPEGLRRRSRLLELLRPVGHDLSSSAVDRCPLAFCHTHVQPKTTSSPRVRPTAMVRCPSHQKKPTTAAPEATLATRAIPSGIDLLDLSAVTGVVGRGSHWSPQSGQRQGSVWVASGRTHWCAFKSALKA